MREPIVSGMFYQADPVELRAEIERCFKNGQFGPGSLPDKTKKSNILGAIIPHAGYQFSGPCAAFAYKEIASLEKPDIFIILGTNHITGRGVYSLKDDFKTPLGIAKTDKEFISALSIQESIPIHAQEHSIEVQLPFLQYLFENVTIAPIIVGVDDYKSIAEKIFNTAKAQNKRIFPIASSDFTHYGVTYGYLPFTENRKENLYKLDKEAVSYIERLDSEAFLLFCREKQATICGQFAIATIIELCKLLGAEKAELLKYYTSGDITKDYNNAVGYASIVFR